MNSRLPRYSDWLVISEGLIPVGRRISMVVLLRKPAWSLEQAIAYRAARLESWTERNTSCKTGTEECAGLDTSGGGFWMSAAELQQEDRGQTEKDKKPHAVGAESKQHAGPDGRITPHPLHRHRYQYSDQRAHQKVQEHRSGHHHPQADIVVEPPREQPRDASPHQAV